MRRLRQFFLGRHDSHDPTDSIHRSLWSDCRIYSRTGIGKGRGGEARGARSGSCWPGRTARLGWVICLSGCVQRSPTVRLYVPGYETADKYGVGRALRRDKNINLLADPLRPGWPANNHTRRTDGRTLNYKHDDDGALTSRYITRQHWTSQTHSIHLVTPARRRRSTTSLFWGQLSLRARPIALISHATCRAEADYAPRIRGTAEPRDPNALHQNIFSTPNSVACFVTFGKHQYESFGPLHCTAYLTQQRISSLEAQSKAHKDVNPTGPGPTPQYLAKGGGSFSIGPR